MKMFGNKSIASILYRVFLTMSILLMLVTIYRVTNMLVGEDLQYSEDGKYIVQKFSDGLVYTEPDNYNELRKRGLFNIGYLSLYLFIVSLIFKSVSAESVFSRKVITILRIFAIVNFVPFLYALIYNITTWRESWFFEDVLYSNLAFVLAGLSTLIITAVFKKGLKVQRENDLTI
ncbi:DUF2975 domain-containing protein [Winogradskyella immobilis]|uniref:DUF2975 domain-containing protein n=1 Tax=Winogradskyella immobilis TaxID=2816852 RepID=A0ABS8EQK1_9FLAO|nr:DUF2975 domain-containing protein [Winogradskyella immobilis]MCC1485286.1 DUF2975 domain-containing protein [Winogradskyella immobilis]MCG0017378.1 DUF2975 domain-containing protein [Winogradskyella immobilis]